MEVERYKMIYRIKNNEEYDDKDNRKEIISGNIRILGNSFVKNNKNKANLIVNNKKYKLKEFINIKEFKDNKLKINIILSKECSNISHIFEKCYKLEEFFFCDNEIYIDDIDNIDNKETYKLYEDNDSNIGYNEDINYDKYNNFYNNSRNDDIFSYYSTITKREEKNDNSTINYIKDNIIIYQYKYYNDMSHMFYDCKSLKFIYDISKLNTNKVINMSYMFYNCESLKSLPDISKWNTNNVTNMSCMFYNCKSLLFLPDISKWNTNNVTNMSHIFYDCRSLILFGDIAIRKKNAVTYMSNKFSSNKNLSSLPHTFEWNTNQVPIMAGLFKECMSLSSFSHIKK